MQHFDINTQSRLSTSLKEQAARLGFSGCGVSRAQRLDIEAARLERWLLEGRHGTMSWMERNFDKRTDPTKLVEGARTVISVLHNYYQPIQQPDDPQVGLVSRYAWNDDYHGLMKERLFLLFEWLDREAGGIHGRVFVDSAPVLDKVWAARAGLGWIGKHSNLISRKLGSYFFIGEMIVDLPLPADGPVADYCGTCTRCIDACPTAAIYQPYVVDAGRCISYLTIEHRGDDIDPSLEQLMGRWIYGCDVCQEVCPWNKFATPTNEARYMPRPNVRDQQIASWAELDVSAFRERFRRSPVKRAKYEGFMRNVRIAQDNLVAGRRLSESARGAR